MRMSERATRDVLHSFQNTRRLRSGAHRVDLVDIRRGGTTAGLPQLYLPGTYRDEGRRGASQGPSEVDPSVRVTRSRTVLHDVVLQCSSLGAAALHPALTKAGCNCTRF
jgi:hypothetical protein